MPYLRPYFDRALTRWIEHVDVNRTSDLLAYTVLAKTGKQFSLLGSRDTVVFYYPVAKSEKGYAIVYSPKTKHRVIRLNESAADLAKLGKSGSKQPSTINIPSELEALLNQDTTQVHWEDIVLGLDSSKFPYSKSTKLRFLGRRKQ